MDQGSTMKRSAVHNFAPTVTKFCVMWEGQALPHDTKFGDSRCEIVGRRVIFIWSLIHGLRWSGLIKAEPDLTDNKSTWVQVKAWCRQATSHYLSQCWPRSMLSFGVTRPQWVNQTWGHKISDWVKIDLICKWLLKWCGAEWVDV